MRSDFTPPDPDVRDLVFTPADPATARTLTPEQVDRYNSEGFVTPLPVFDAAEVAELRDYIVSLVDSALADERDSYSVNAYHLVCERMYRLTLTPRILDYVEDLLGPDFVCWGTTVFCKLPGDHKEVPLHQDAAYWPFTPSGTVTAWLALDDTDAGNAAMQFVPGSHRLGALRHEDLALDGTRARKRQLVDARSHGNRYTNVLAAGELSLHSDLLLHGSPANDSDRRRTGLTIRYARAEVRALPGWEWWHEGALHCRGDIPGHWANRRRPRGEHPRLMSVLFGGDSNRVPSG